MTASGQAEQPVTAPTDQQTATDQPEPESAQTVLISHLLNELDDLRATCAELSAEVQRLKAESELHLHGGARRAQELSLALSAAERRVKEAEATQQSLLAVSEQYVLEIRELETKLDHALELMNDQTTGSFYVLAEVDRLQTENKILQRTAELQLALVTSTADVVEAAREVLVVRDGPWRKFRDRMNDLTGAFAVLDKASPPATSIESAAPTGPVSPIEPSETATASSTPERTAP